MVESARVRVRVQPGAKRNQLVSISDGVLRIKLVAPPIEGRANGALVELLSELLRVAKSNVEILRGHGSRDKLVALHGLTDGELAQRLEAALHQES